MCLSSVRLLFFLFFFVFFFLEKKSTSHMPSGISSNSKKLLQVILSSAEPLPPKNVKRISFILSLLGFILQRLCSDKYPMSHPIQVAYILGFSTFLYESRTCDHWKLLAASGRVKGAQVPRIHNLEDFGIHPRSKPSKPCLRKRRHQPQVGTPLPHVPGVRMT